LLAAMAYGFILTWVIMLAGLITVNISYGRDYGLIFYSTSMLLAALVFSILISGLSACIGVLVSLRAGSVRQAQQMMSAGMLVLFLPFMLIQFIPVRVVRSITEMATSVSSLQIALLVAFVLLLIEGILIVIALRLFQRSKLILD